MNASRRTGAFGGAQVGNPKWARILTITAGGGLIVALIEVIDTPPCTEQQYLDSGREKSYSEARIGVS